MAVAALALVSCAPWTPDVDGFSEQDVALIRAMALPQAPPVDGTNELAGNAAAASLGQQLFFDQGLASGAVRVACSDCHSPAAFFDDRRLPNNVSLGLAYTARNAPTLVDVGWYRWFAWDGRSDSLWAQCLVAYQAKAVMNGDGLTLGRQLAERYADRWEPLFGPLPSELTHPDGGAPDPKQLEAVLRSSGKALAAYLTLLVSGDAPIDRYARGDHQALSASARRGLALFLGRAGCVECHRGPTFTDNDFHSLGLPQAGDHVPAEDTGREAGLSFLSKSAWRSGPLPEATGKEHGAFRTKSLRNVALTAPYFHAGQAATLREVVAYYNAGPALSGGGTSLQPLGLSETEVAELVDFLEALTGQPVPPQLTCDDSRLPADGGRPGAGVTRCEVLP